MPPRRRLIAAAAVMLLLVPGPAAADPDEPFVGIDGQLHPSAPVVVTGTEGDLFWGPDFDLACGLGARTVRPMRALSKLTEVIRASGRRVVWTVAPSKSNVLGDRLSGTLPHGSCDRAGLDRQNAVLDSFDDPSYLPLRRRLVRDERQMYWKTDPHWTTVAGSVYASRVAHTLDRGLARRQHYTYGTETRVGMFTTLLGGTQPETLPTAMPAGPVRVRTARDSTSDWAGYPELVFDHSWVSRPRTMTWPGRTLLLGDSFTLCALPALRPLFRRGQFLWTNSVSARDVRRGIVAADTVVIEVLQTFLTMDSPLSSTKFRNQLRRALR